MYIIMAVIFGLFIISGTQSGHPWTLTCYQCRACNINCPLGYDVAAYVAAAATNNPDTYMSASKLQLTLEESYTTDENMIIEINGEKMTAGEAVENSRPMDLVVQVKKLRAKDAAKFDPLCGNCESYLKENKKTALCPINLPITDVIRDLKDDGKFG